VGLYNFCTGRLKKLTIYWFNLTFLSSYLAIVGLSSFMMLMGRFRQFPLG
jgi:hypothetical protein